MKTKNFVLVLILIGLGLLAACSQPEEPAPTPATPPEEPTAAPEEPGEGGEQLPQEGSDQTWANIQAAGKLVAGTSADYPPFAYYTTNFQLDGYDVALIQAVGEELGVEVEIKDIAFDGLDEALQLGQIDVAIAALSVTPEREGVVDFSNIYYVGEDGLLAQNADVSITDVGDLAGKRIGVQNKSVYQDWVQDELVDTGLIPERNLHAYGQIEQAIADMQLGRIDLVMLDLKPAEVAVQAMDVELVAQGLNRQRFAIAHPQGEPSLQQAINDALIALQNKGVLADLARQYLDLDELLPIEPQPPVDGVEPPIEACVDGMAFIEDINLDDNNMQNPPSMLPGQSFRKGWRVQNIGTCTWNSSYALMYVGGNVSAARMGGSSEPVVGEVKPGATYDFYVDLVAPTTPGTYQGFWSMRNGEGDLFGQRIWVGITVPGAQPTPVPTVTPSPNITFTVNQTNIQQGECVTFSWDVQNIQAVWFYPDGQDYSKYPVEGQGSSTQCPAQTTTYNLRVLKTDGTTEIRQITIVVEPSNQSPKITRFNVSPSQIQVGQCVQVSWEVEGNVSNITIMRNGIILWAGAPVKGSLQDCPPDAGFAAYVIEATGQGGSDRLQTNVSVLQ